LKWKTVPGFLHTRERINMPKKKAVPVQPPPPLFLNYKIAKTINDSATCVGMRGRKSLIVKGANWQRTRIIQHLEGLLRELQMSQDKSNSRSIPCGGDVGLGMLSVTVRAEYEKQIGLLQSLISELKGE
jgi:hypothetical protein